MLFCDAESERLAAIRDRGPSDSPRFRPPFDCRYWGPRHVGLLSSAGGTVQGDGLDAGSVRSPRGSVAMAQHTRWLCVHTQNLLDLPTLPMPSRSNRTTPGLGGEPTCIRGRKERTLLSSTDAHVWDSRRVTAVLGERRLRRRPPFFRRMADHMGSASQIRAPS